METFHIPATISTPFVSFSENRKMVIKGRSISENEITFYKPVISWASHAQLKVLEVDVDLEYVNSRSSKKLFQLFKEMEANSEIKALIINWYYDEGDEDALFRGQMYQDSLPKVKFNFFINREAADH